MTIGYIAQEVTPDCISASQVDDILTQIIANLENTDNEIVETAITAMLNLIVYTKKNMSQPAEKEFILNAIYGCLKNSDKNIRVYAMQCLVEISRLYYENIPNDFENLVTVTKHHVL